VCVSLSKSISQPISISLALGIQPFVSLMEDEKNTQNNNSNNEILIRALVIGGLGLGLATITAIHRNWSNERRQAKEKDRMCSQVREIYMTAKGCVDPLDQEVAVNAPASVQVEVHDFSEVSSNSEDGTLTPNSCDGCEDEQLTASLLPKSVSLMSVTMHARETANIKMVDLDVVMETCSSSSGSTSSDGETDIDESEKSKTDKAVLVRRDAGINLRVLEALLEMERNAATWGWAMIKVVERLSYASMIC